MAPDTVRPPGMVTYPEAAAILGISIQSVGNLVSRKHLRTFPDPTHGRRRLLLKSEVEARKALRQKYRYGIPPWQHDRSQVLTGDPSALSAEDKRFVAGVAAGVLALGSIIGLAKSSDPVIRGMSAAVLVALGALLVVEWRRAGLIDDVERRVLERSISADLPPEETAERVLSLIDRYGVPGAAAAASPAS